MKPVFSLVFLIVLSGCAVDVIRCGCEFIDEIETSDDAETKKAGPPARPRLSPSQWERSKT